MDEAELRELRAKYLDWCSARLADGFLDLSPEEIYELARPDPSGEGSGVGSGASVSASYTVLVQRVTESLLGRIALPTFEEWRAAYARTPERYDAELLGFWQGASGDGGVEP